jgi:hypothetical protein
MVADIEGLCGWLLKSLPEDSTIQPLGKQLTTNATFLSPITAGFVGTRMDSPDAMQGALVGVAFRFE